jgi:hypothetical protein
MPIIVCAAIAFDKKVIITPKDDKELCQNLQTIAQNINQDDSKKIIEEGK